MPNIAYINVWPEESNKVEFARTQRYGIERQAKEKGIYVPAACWFRDGVPICPTGTHDFEALFEALPEHPRLEDAADYRNGHFNSFRVCKVCGMVVQATDLGITKTLRSEDAARISDTARTWAVKVESYPTTGVRP